MFILKLSRPFEGEKHNKIYRDKGERERKYTEQRPRKYDGMYTMQRCPAAPPQV